MTDPSYRETPEAPPQRWAEEVEAEALRTPPSCVCDFHLEAAAERLRKRTAPDPPLPPWMPTPEELDAWSEQISRRPLTYENEVLLLGAVRWLLEDRENR